MKNNTVLLILIALIFNNCQAQNTDLYDVAKNNIEFYGDSSRLMRFFKQIKNCSENHKSQLSIVHIGDSHLQAGFFSSWFRFRLQTGLPNLKSSYGFVFPYKAAKTNGPRDYKVSYTGNWKRCRSVGNSENCELGLSGMSITTTNPNASLEIRFNDENILNYYYQSVRIFHPINNKQFKLIVNQQIAISETEKDSLGFTEFRFAEPLTKLTIQFEKADSKQQEFTLYGIDLQTNTSGVVYHSMGVNGAFIQSYLKCNLFSPHLQALKPDLVIVSLGANHCFTAHFRESDFYNYYENLISQIEQSCPNASLLLTVPADMKFGNNVIYARKIIRKLAVEHNAAVWDMFGTMGEVGSINRWLSNGLAVSDKVHFTEAGYQLQADLFYDAFIRILNYKF